jgi:hypothetical protein
MKWPGSWICVLSLSCLGVLVGCGPGARLGGGKEGAARALAQASSALIRPPSSSNVDLVNLGLNVDVKGTRGGTATLTYKRLTSAGSDALETTVAYRNYVEDGRTYYNGNLQVRSSSPTGKVLSGEELTVSGKLKLSGDVGDILVVDVVERVSFMSAGQLGSDLALAITGTLSTSDADYTFSSEQLTFDVSETLPTETR